MAGEVLQNSSFHHTVLRADDPANEMDMELELIDPAQEDLTSSLYTLASTQSQFSNALDNWIRSATPITASYTANTAVQDGRSPLLQRSTQAGPLANSGIWYILAMILPLFSINTSQGYFGCSPSAILHAAELAAGYIRTLFAFIRRQLRRLAEDQVARDIFATTMDVILIIYALGFLILSMYQASLFD